MNNEKALMLTNKGCFNAFFNKLYGNNSPGALLDCITLPQRLPCANCLPCFIGPLYFPNPSLDPQLAPFVIPPPTSTPNLFRNRIYLLEMDNDSYRCTPLYAYFTTPTIVGVLDNFLHISSLNTLLCAIPEWDYHPGHGGSLLALIGHLQQEFAVEFEAARLDQNEKNCRRAKSKRKAKTQDSEDESEMDDEDEDADADEEEEEIAQLPVVPPRPTHSVLKNKH
ncbi:hypothetical protein K438DRAFT_1989983 [Mycena galopus ATCC 62051]|nr:hypothetical protein K438DRAFT_1989983 [Mycena galopus ATCC 62051]